MKFSYIKDKICKNIKGFLYRKYFVVLDGRANSVTLSKGIYEHIMMRARIDSSIFVFRIIGRRTYGFCLREDWEELRNAQTDFCQLQYNQEHNKIGFRSERPSVTAILDDYNLPLEKMVRLTCIPRKDKNGEVYYEIINPNS